MHQLVLHNYLIEVKFIIELEQSKFVVIHKFAKNITNEKGFIIIAKESIGY